MWPLNYEDLNRFHISLGVGLMVAAFLLHITNTNTTWSNIEKMEVDVKNKDSLYFAKVGENKTYLETKTEALLFSSNANTIMSTTLFVVGLVFFSWGYFTMPHTWHFQTWWHLLVSVSSFGPERDSLMSVQVRRGLPVVILCITVLSWWCFS